MGATFLVAGHALNHGNRNRRHPHLVEVEGALVERNLAGIDPVGDIDVVVGQHCSNGAAQQCRVMA